jgi:hypothetical protein
MDAAATVEQGKWLEGPDGRREADVLVSGTVDGIERRVLIECKDYNPATTGPIGIEVVDALESKRRDLNVYLAMICSNAGFTAPAVEKASRVNIPLIGVMRKGDSRIRFLIHEPHYTRRIRVEKLEITLFLGGSPVELPANALDDSVLVDGAPLLNWVRSRAMRLITLNPVVNGTLLQQGRLTSPVSLETTDGVVGIDEINLQLTVAGGWYLGDVALDATAAFYDWIRRRVRLTPQGGELSLSGIAFTEGQLVDAPPDYFVRGQDFSRGQGPEGEVGYGTIKIEGGAYLAIEGDVPKLDHLLHPDDLELRAADISAEMIKSVNRDY